MFTNLSVNVSVFELYTFMISDDLLLNTII